MILALETSCDETAAACVTREGRVLSSVVASQAELHARYGGVVPEVASRRHLELAVPVVREALERAGATLADADGVAVTHGPGLIGALLVGLSAAKALAWARRLPLDPGRSPPRACRLAVPAAADGEASSGATGLRSSRRFVCLLASGGHTMLLEVRDRAGFRVLGSTLDDAAGEAFDKGARLLGLGYPGGAAIDRLARGGDAGVYRFPVARVPGLDSLLLRVEDGPPLRRPGARAGRARAARADLAASYQRAIVRALVEQTARAMQVTGLERLAVVGGVAANSELRARLAELGAVPAPLPLCTDNAAMIASAARYAPSVRFPGYLALDAYASAH